MYILNDRFDEISEGTTLARFEGPSRDSLRSLWGGGCRRLTADWFDGGDLVEQDAEVQVSIGPWGIEVDRVGHYGRTNLIVLEDF